MASEEILIVDDNLINLKLARIVLEEGGFRVRTASDAAEALRAAETSTPRLILMDLHLPGIDGFELTHMLKRAPATKDITIVALTACAMAGDEERARAAGCDGYITKPIDALTLPLQIAEYIAASSRIDDGSAR